MNIYLVGGAVRDRLLGLQVKDRDWVVVGATPQQMLDQGYQQVGRDFPVFLHPDSHEEYALARIERKTGAGHTGFVCDTSSGVTLEEDLLRRDLTINAMAEAEDGAIVDPYGGQADLEARKLRHVSKAFAEDPLRVLRVARFAARYAHLGFTVAEETMQLMQQMAEGGELAELSAERVWKEMEKALLSPGAPVFFEVLREAKALAFVLPELDALWGVPQRAEYHPEVDTGVHVMMALQYSVDHQQSLASRVAVLLHDLGKGATPEEEWPRHIGHELRSRKLCTKVCKRLRLPNNVSDLAEKVAEYHTHCHRALELKPATVLKLLTQLDVLRRPERMTEFTDACLADARGRLNFETSAYPQADYLLAAADCIQGVSAKAFVDQGLSGKAIGEAMHNERLQRLKRHKESWQEKVNDESK
jgi:tRNA nucleotidyltransferase (CCA-adding enzyme)